MEPKINLIRESSRSPVAMRTPVPGTNMLQVPQISQYISGSPSQPQGFARVITGPVQLSNHLPVIRGPTTIQTVQIQRNELDVLEKAEKSRALLESNRMSGMINSKFSASKRENMQENILFERITELENELDRERKEVETLNKVNESLEKYVRELEGKITSFYTERHFFEHESSKRSEQNTERLLSKIAELEVEIERLNKTNSEKDAYIKILYDEHEKHKAGLTKNVEVEKSYLESSVKIYKINISELENKLAIVRNENERLLQTLNFQNVQMEELRQECDVKVRDIYEVKIKETEEKVTKLVNENERIITINMTLVKEIEGMKSMYETLEKRKESQLSEIKGSLVEQLDREKQSLRERYELEKSSWEQQIKHARQFSSVLEKKMEDIVTENEKMRREIREKDNYLQEWQEKVTIFEKKLDEAENTEQILLETRQRNEDLEHKLAVLVAENQKLVDLVDLNSEEIENWRNKYNKLNESNMKYIEEMKHQFEVQRDILIEKQLREKTTILLAEKSKIDIKLKMVENDKTEAEEKMLKLIDDNEKLNTVVLEKFKDIESLNRKVQNLSYVEGEKSLLERDYYNLRERVVELEKNISNLLTENDKLNKGLHERISELEVWIAKYGKLETEMNDLRKEYEEREKFELDRFQEQRQQEHLGYQQELERLMKKIREFDGVLDAQNRAIQHKDGAIEERYAEMERMRLENRELVSRIGELKQVLDRKEVEIEGLVGKLENLEENFNIQYEEIRKKLLKAEKEQIDYKRQIESRNSEINDLKIKCEKIDFNMHSQIDERLGIQNQTVAPRMFIQQGNALSKINESVMARQGHVQDSSRIQEDIHKFKIQFEDTKQRYESEILQLRSRNEELIQNFTRESARYIQQINDLRANYEAQLMGQRNHYEMSRGKTREEIDSFNRIVNEMKITHEEEIHRMRMEIEDLHVNLDVARQERDAILLRGNENEELKRRMEELAREKKQLIEKHKEEIERGIQITVQKEVAEILKKHHMEKKELEKIIGTQKLDINNLEERILHLESEKHRILTAEKSQFESVISKLKNDVCLLEERVLKAESDRDRCEMRARSEIDSLNLQITNIEFQREQEVLGLRRELEWGLDRKLNDDRLFLEDEIAKHKRIILDLESRINVLKGENEKLFNDNHRMHSDMEQLRARCLELEEVLSSERKFKAELESKLSQHRAEIDKLRILIQERNRDIELVHRQAMKTEQIAKINEADMARLHAHLNEEAFTNKMIAIDQLHVNNRIIGDLEKENFVKTRTALENANMKAFAASNRMFSDTTNINALNLLSTGGMQTRSKLTSKNNLIFENERLNKQILNRCREIVNDW